MKIWIRDNLGPTIRKSSHSKVKIIIYDDQRTLLIRYADAILSDKKSNNYSDGIAVHWYLDNVVSPNVLAYVHKKYPDKFLLYTEASQGSLRSFPVQLGLWDRAESYASNIIENINYWVTGWTDWNMALDLQGGPTFTSNFVDAPIIVNVSAQEFLKQPMYYAIGHFSKFVTEDSQRIGVSSFGNRIPTTAFLRPDKGIVLVILNKYDRLVKTVVTDRNRGNIMVNLTPRSLTTIVYW